jgi:PIN domain nuclease of toxin-antitoxin system
VTRYLLDTNVVVRWMLGTRGLSRRTAGILGREDCVVSAASVWEMIVKSVRGKLALPDGSLSESIEAQGFRVIAIAAAHVEATRRFDKAIDDPFDRLLLATADCEGLSLLTADAHLLALGARLRIPVVEG